MSWDVFVSVLIAVGIVGYVAYGVGYQRGQDAEKRRRSGYGGTDGPE